MTKKIFILFVTKDAEAREYLGTFTSLSNAKNQLNTYFSEKGEEKYKSLHFQISENELNSPFVEKIVDEQKLKKNNSVALKILKRLKDENSGKLSKELRHQAFEEYKSSLDLAKVKKDKPKRIRSNYINFSVANRKLVKEANPTKEFKEISKMLGEKWTTLSDAEKEAYKSKEQPSEKKIREKKKPTNYLNFCKKNRATLKAANPTLKFGEIGKLLGEKWHELSVDEKKSYI